MANMLIQPLWLTHFIEILLVLEFQLTKFIVGVFSYKAHFRPQISSNAGPSGQKLHCNMNADQTKLHQACGGCQIKRLIMWKTIGTILLLIDINVCSALHNEYVLGLSFILYSNKNFNHVLKLICFVIVKCFQCMLDNNYLVCLND